MLGQVKVHYCRMWSRIESGGASLELHFPPMAHHEWVTLMPEDSIVVLLVFRFKLDALAQFPPDSVIVGRRIVLFPVAIHDLGRVA